MISSIRFLLSQRPRPHTDSLKTYYLNRRCPGTSPREKYPETREPLRMSLYVFLDAGQASPFLVICSRSSRGWERLSLEYIWGFYCSGEMSDTLNCLWFRTALRAHTTIIQMKRYMYIFCHLVGFRAIVFVRQRPYLSARNIRLLEG